MRHPPRLPSPASDRERDLAIAELSREIVRFDGDGVRDPVRLFADGVELDSPAARDAALEKARAGELNRLEAEVVAYVQTPGKPNRKFRRMAPKAMQRLASSLVGKPALKNHDHGNVDARAGTISESKLERADMPDGGTRYTIRQTLSLVKSWAIVGVLDGTLDALSISWLGTEPVLCSAHGTEIFAKCWCLPGDRLDGGDVVEWVYPAADGLETSFVNVPAVTETGVDRVRELALSLDSSDLAGILGVTGAPRAEGAKKMDPRLITALGLPATATDADVLTAIERLKATDGESRDKLAIANEQLATHAAAAVTAAAAAEVATATATQKKIDTAIADLAAKGKLVPGGASEKALRSLGKRDVATFDAAVADMLQAPAVTPVGAPAPAPAPAPSTVDEVLSTNPEVANYLKRAGVTKAQFEAHGLPRLLEQRLAER